MRALSLSLYASKHSKSNQGEVKAVKQFKQLNNLKFIYIVHSHVVELYPSISVKMAFQAMKDAFLQDQSIGCRTKAALLKSSKLIFEKSCFPRGGY